MKLRNIRTDEIVEVKEVNVDCYVYFREKEGCDKLYYLYSPTFTKLEDEDYFINLDYEPKNKKYVCENGYIFRESLQYKEVIENEKNKMLSLFDSYDVFEDWKRKIKNEI